MARFNPAQVKKITDQNAGRVTSTASPVQKVQTSSMAKPLSPTAQTQSAVLTDKGIVKTPVTNVASNAPTSVPKVTASTPVKPTFVPTRQDKEQYWNLLNQQQKAGQYDAGTQVRMADEARKQAAAPTGQIKFDTEGLFGEAGSPTAPTTPAIGTTGATGTTPTPGQEGAVTTSPVEGEVVDGVPGQQGSIPDVSTAKTPAEAAMLGGAGMTAQANQYLQAGQQMAQENYNMAESARRLDLLSTLNSTNAREMADAMGVKMENMTMAQLEQLATASGLKPDQAVLNRIEQEGAAAIQDIRMERGDVLAENEFTRQQTERIFDRALDDRERFNAAQDVKLKNAMATLGGGSASQGSLVEVMGAQEQGRRAMEDLSAEYAGRVDSIGRQAQSIVREYGAMERQINQQVAGAIEAKYAELQNTIKDLRKQGVTNTKDLNAAMLPLMKEYVGFYNDAVKWQAEQMLDVQKEVNNETERLYRRSFDTDKEMAQQTGMVYKNGQPMLDANGQPVPTIDGLREMSAIDYQQSQMTGIVHKNGEPLMDANGQPIMTADLMKFQTTEQRLQSQFEQELGFKMSQEQFSQTMEAAKFSQDQYEFEQNTGLKLTEQGFQDLKFQAEMVEKGLTMGASVVIAPTASFNPANSKYGVQPTDGGIQINAPTSGSKLVSPRRQCGAYVNDVIGIPSFFGDTIAQKKTKVTSSTPTPGSAFVLDVPGLKWGHVGMVEKVNPDGTIVISESNFDGKENFRRITTTMDALRNRGLVGFTGGLMTEKKIQKMPGLPGATGVVGTGKQLGEAQVKMLSDAKFLPNVMGELNDLIIGDKVSFGPIETFTRGLNPLSGFGAYDTEQKAAEAQLRRATQLVGSFMEGGVLRKEDEEKYAKMLPSLSDPKDVAKRKLEGVKEMLESKRKQYLQDFNASGYNVSGLADIPGMDSGNAITNLTNNFQNIFNK